jgi:hypothetical protein
MEFTYLEVFAATKFDEVLSGSQLGQRVQTFPNFQVLTTLPFSRVLLVQTFRLFRDRFCLWKVRRFVLAEAAV